MPFFLFIFSSCKLIETKLWFLNGLLLNKNARTNRIPLNSLMEVEEVVTSYAAHWTYLRCTKSTNNNRIKIKHSWNPLETSIRGDFFLHSCNIVHAKREIQLAYHWWHSNFTHLSMRKHFAGSIFKSDCLNLSSTVFLHFQCDSILLGMIWPVYVRQ